MRSTRFVAVGMLSTILLFAASGPLAGQDHQQSPDEEDGQTEHAYHRNHFGGLLGVTTRSDADEAAFTIGLEYARVFSPHWAAVTYLEQISSKLERDLTVAVGAAYYPTSRMALILAVGAEAAEKEVTHNGVVETETEFAPLVRIGFVYGFPLTSTAAIGPTLMVDQAEDRTTWVLGISMAVGF